MDTTWESVVIEDHKDVWKTHFTSRFGTLTPPATFNTEEQANNYCQRVAEYMEHNDQVFPNFTSPDWMHFADKTLGVLSTARLIDMGKAVGLNDDELFTLRGLPLSLPDYVTRIKRKQGEIHV